MLWLIVQLLFYTKKIVQDKYYGALIISFAGKNDPQTRTKHHIWTVNACNIFLIEYSYSPTYISSMKNNHCNKCLDSDFIHNLLFEFDTPGLVSQWEHHQWHSYIVNTVLSKSIKSNQLYTQRSFVDVDVEQRIKTVCKS